MAAQEAGEALFMLLMLGASLLALVLLIGRELYRRHQLWRFIAQDEDLPDPLEILYLYKAKGVEN